MKDKIIACILLISLGGNLCAETVKGIFFPGIRTEYSIGGVQKNTGIQAMEEQLSDAYRAFASLGSQVVIGHSQGAYKALGYGNYLKEKGEGDKVKAIIAIGGPVRGFTPLVRGKDDLTRRIKNFYDIFNKGLASIFPFPYLSVAGPAICDAILKENVFGGSDSRAFISRMISSNPGDSSMVSDAVLADFMPNSTYLKNRISPGIIPEQGHWAKVEVGRITVPVIKVTGWFRFTIEWITIPIYKTVWVVDKPAEKIPRLPNDVPVGFIVGNQSNPFDLIESAYGFKRSDAEKILEIFTGVMEISQTINQGLGVACDIVAILNIWNIIVFLGYKAMAAGYYINANNAREAAKLARNFPQRYNTDILLTNESDGFIPSPAQKWNPDELLFKPIGNNGTEWYIVYDVNHQTELEDGRIWGEGGNFDNPTNKGKVGQWLQEQKLFDWQTPTRRYMEGPID